MTTIVIIIILFMLIDSDCTVKKERKMKIEQFENNTPQQKKPKKSGRAFWLSALLGAACAGVIVGSLYFFGLFDRGTATYEGEGFSSPEEAITAYLEALQEGNAEKMLSTFAIETATKHYNFETDYYYRDYDTQGYARISSVTLPTDTGFGYNLAVHRRAAALTENIAAPFFMAAESKFDHLEEYLESCYYDSVVLKSNKERKAYIQEHELEDCMPVLKTIKIGTIYPDERMDELDERQIERGKPTQAERKTQIYGADEYGAYLVDVEVDGNECIFGMELLCYDGVWYNFSCGTPTMHVAASSHTGGFVSP